MSKLDGLAFNSLVERVYQELVKMNSEESETGLVTARLNNNNILSVNLEIKKLVDLQIPGLISVEHNVNSR